MKADQKRILIACVGNIFLGDDAFGVEVARHLVGKSYPPGVQVVDFGIRGMDLTYTLLDGYDILILVDTVSRGNAPGTLYLLEHDNSIPGGGTAADAHSMDPVKVLNFASTLGARVGRTLIVGCEPTNLEEETILDGLSEPVRAAIAPAVNMIDTLINELTTVPIGTNKDT
jgi:hydrogenase maturation protease